MITLDPPIRVRLLSEVMPGSLVQLGAARGLCAVSPRDPNQKFMVMYDAERESFECRQTPVEVLDFGADLLIVPNLKSLVEAVLPTEASTELLLIGDSPKLVFEVNDDEPRLLDLRTGAIEPLQRTTLMAAFRAWMVGVNTVSGGVLPLLDVGPGFGAVFEDDGPTEPDEV